MVLTGQDGGEYIALISDKDVLLSLTLGCKHVHGIQVYEIKCLGLAKNNAKTVKHNIFVKNYLNQGDSDQP